VGERESCKKQDLTPHDISGIDLYRFSYLNGYWLACNLSDPVKLSHGFRIDAVDALDLFVGGPMGAEAGLLITDNITAILKRNCCGFPKESDPSLLQRKRKDKVNKLSCVIMFSFLCPSVPRFFCKKEFRL